MTDVPARRGRTTLAMRADDLRELMDDPDADADARTDAADTDGEGKDA